MMHKEMMNIPKLKLGHNELEEISKQLDLLPKQSIAYEPWLSGFSGKADFSIAYGNDAMFLKYYVVEEHVRATFIHTKDPVYKDSCVEFFISFKSRAEYYNLEFNSIGTCLAGYGTGKHERRFLNNANVEQIKSLSKFKNVIYGEKPMISWEMTLMIPKDIFVFDNLDDLEGEAVSVNFFKCGDDLPNPHYLCWSEIRSEEPNFHQPEFFGQSIFA